MPGATLKKSKKFLGPATDRLKAIFLLGTLKPRRAGREFSHTETLCELVVEELRPHNVVSEIVRLVEYDIKPGITGEEDGEQHITGNIANFLLSMGVTLPPLCAVSYQDEYTRATKRSLGKKFREDKHTADAAARMARNLAFFARLLSQNNIPEQAG